MEAKFLLLAVFLFSAAHQGWANKPFLTCTSVTQKEVLGNDTLIGLLGMETDCRDVMIKQINLELEAALTYLSLGAHFSRDTVNLPGFAKFFFESASEERQHAIKLIEYLLMRNELIHDFKDMITVTEPRKFAEPTITGLDALNRSLSLEVEVTSSIRGIIHKCESSSKSNDYHLVDYLSGEFLTEQYQGQRDLAGKVMTLTKMIKSHGKLGQFLFDKKLLMGEI